MKLIIYIHSSKISLEFKSLNFASPERLTDCTAEETLVLTHLA